MPAKVDKIVKAIRKENPDMPEDKLWAIAYSQYKKSQDKGKQPTKYVDELVEGASHNEGSHYALRNEIMEFFRKVQYPDALETAQFAESLGVTGEAFMKELNAMTSDLLSEYVFTAKPGASGDISANKQLDWERSVFKKTWTDTQTSDGQNESVSLNQEIFMDFGHRGLLKNSQLLEEGGKDE